MLSWIHVSSEEFTERSQGTAVFESDDLQRQERLPKGGCECMR